MKKSTFEQIVEILKEAYEVVPIDASESSRERPKKRIQNRKRMKNSNNKEKHFYSGKKKGHTVKSQVAMDKKSKQVICTSFSNKIYSFPVR